MLLKYLTIRKMALNMKSNGLSNYHLLRSIGNPRSLSTGSVTSYMVKWKMDIEDCYGNLRNNSNYMTNL